MDVETREVEGRGVAAFAARAFAAGDVVLQEPALVVSALAAGDANRSLVAALAVLERSRRIQGGFSPGGHLGALVALRDLGPRECRRKLLSKFGGGVAVKRDREHAVLKAMVCEGLVPQAAGSFSADEYQRLRLVFRLNAFLFDGAGTGREVKEGDEDYEVGEVVFDEICRFNHSCEPNLEFNLRWSDALGTVVNRVEARVAIEKGQELNISYLPLRLRLPVEERRGQLLRHWGFTCDCRLCMEEGGPPQPSQPLTKWSSQGCYPPRPVEETSSDESVDGVGFDDLRDPDLSPES